MLGDHWITKYIKHAYTSWLVEENDKNLFSLRKLMQFPSGITCLFWSSHIFHVIIDR